jgi:1-phosphofructokinase family hexose kinase
MIYTVTLNPSLDRTLHYARVAWGAVNRAASSRLDLSGKGVNISIALQQLGIESVMLGFAAGVSGRALVEGLTAQGYRCAFVEIAGETRSNITLIEDETGRSAKLNEPGPPVAEGDLVALEERLCALLAPGDLVALAGSLPPGAPEDCYARLIAAAHARGALVALDSSGAALREGCRAAPDLIKPNESEAEALLGRPVGGDLVGELRALRGMGPQRVLLSQGALGAAYADEEGCWQATPPAIVEVNNVGAGDATLAGALYAWAQGLPPEELARWAVATGTATAQTDGTTFPTRDVVEELYGRVRIERLG